MLLVRPTDRMRSTLRALCATCFLIFTTIGALATCMAYSLRHKVRLESLEAAIDAAVSFIWAAGVAWVSCRHPSHSCTDQVELGISPAARSSHVVPTMHFALSSIWKLARSYLFIFGVNTIAFGSLRQMNQLLHPETVQPPPGTLDASSYGPFRHQYPIDIAVGMVLVLMAVILTPERRLQWQLSTDWHRPIVCRPKQKAHGMAIAELDTSLMLHRSVHNANHAPRATDVEVARATVPSAIIAPAHVQPHCIGGWPKLSLQELIGCGEYGAVYTVHLPTSGKSVAAKVFKQGGEHCSAGTTSRALVDEVLLAMSLKHKFICTTLGTAVVEKASASGGPPSSGVAVLMEFVQGGTLDQFLFSQGSKPCSPPPLPLRTRLAAELAEATAYLHSNDLLHCDLKPTNVLLSAGQCPHVKLCDLGLAQRLSMVERYKALGVRGTPRYMAPEVAFHEYSFPADVYSFGVILYELLHVKRFMASPTQFGVLLQSMEGKRPQAALSTEGLAELGGTHGALASSMALLIDRCWAHHWELRPSMNHVVGCIETNLDQAGLRAESLQPWEPRESK